MNQETFCFAGDAAKLRDELTGARGMAAYARHAMASGHTDEETNRFFAKALFALGEDWSADELLPVVMEIGRLYGKFCGHF